MKIFVYAILFILGYRILKKFFAPSFGDVQQGSNRRETFTNQASSPDKSNVIEDVDYEEID